MSYSHIYIKAGEEPVSVRDGFNWVAFFLPGPWALFKGLNFLGLLMIAIPLSIPIAIVNANPDGAILCLILSSILAIVYGFNGNSWVKSKLEREGYKQAGNIDEVLIDCDNKAAKLERLTALKNKMVLAQNEYEEIKKKVLAQGEHVVHEAAPIPSSEQTFIFQDVNVQKETKPEIYNKKRNELNSGVRWEYWLIPAAAIIFFVVIFSEIKSHFEPSITDDYTAGNTAYYYDDYETAYRLFLRAAEKGHVDAQFYLGVIYYYGNGVPKHYGEAAKWNLRAANQGYALAQYNLGLMYARGEGVPKNYAQAYCWFNLSAAQGEENAKNNMRIIERQMTPSQIAEGQKLSINFRPKPER